MSTPVRYASRYGAPRPVDARGELARAHGAVAAIQQAKAKETMRSGRPVWRSIVAAISGGLALGMLFQPGFGPLDEPPWLIIGILAIFSVWLFCIPASNRPARKRH